MIIIEGETFIFFELDKKESMSWGIICKWEAPLIQRWYFFDIFVVLHKVVFGIVTSVVMPILNNVEDRAYPANIRLGENALKTFLSSS